MLLFHTERIWLLRCGAAAAATGGARTAKRVEAEVAGRAVGRALDHAVDLREANGLEGANEEQGHEELVRGGGVVRAERRQGSVLRSGELDAQVDSDIPCGAATQPEKVHFVSVGCSGWNVCASGGGYSSIAGSVERQS